MTHFQLIKHDTQKNSSLVYNRTEKSSSIQHETFITSCTQKLVYHKYKASVTYERR